MKNYQLLTNKNETVQLKDLVGAKGLVVFFYPKAKTSLCSLEVQEYQNHLRDFKKIGFNIIGVSQDNPQVNADFCGEYQLKFALISDHDKQLTKEFKLTSEIIALKGEKFQKYERSSFVLNKNLEIIKEFRNVEPTTHVKEILEFLKTF